MRLRTEHDARNGCYGRSLSAPENNSLAYLTAVISGRVLPLGDLSALDTNVVVMQILDAARESARTGRTVHLARLGE